MLNPVMDIQTHSILYDYYNNQKNDVSSTITLKGQAYKVTTGAKGDYCVESTTGNISDFFNSLFGSAGNTSELIRSTLRQQINPYREITPESLEILRQYDSNKKSAASSSIVLNGQEYRVTQSNGVSEEISVEGTINTSFWKPDEGAQTMKLIWNVINNEGYRELYATQYSITKNKDGAPNNLDHKPIDGICFGGGGARAVAYAGILNQLGDEKIKQVTEVSGSSSGGLIAMMVSLGLTTEEISTFLRNQPIAIDQKVLEVTFRKIIVYALRTKYAFFVQLEKIFGKDYTSKDLENISFSQLEQLRYLTKSADTPTTIKMLHIPTSTFGAEVPCSATVTPKLPIIKAVMAGAALPFALAPVEVSRSLLTHLPDEFRGDENGNVKLIDGGIHNLLPHFYHESKKNNLILSMVENKDNFLKPMSFLSERLSELAIWQPFNKYRRADGFIAERFGVHHVETGITTQDTEEAQKSFDRINYQSAKDLDYYLKFGEKRSERSDAEIKNDFHELMDLKKSGRDKLPYKKEEREFN